MTAQATSNITKTEYIILQSVRPEENRYRAYRITITLVETSKRLFVVTCSWGRVAQLGWHKHFVFEDREAVDGFVASVLNKRKRHGYTILYRSGGFPEHSVIEELGAAKVLLRQTSLFETNV